jgi:DNA polymerase
MLHLDFETYCDLDVRAVGAHTYARHPSCAVLMLAYAFDDGPIALWEPLKGQPLPPVVLAHIKAGKPLGSHNVEFEANIFRHVLGIHTDWPQWHDTAVMALIHGYPKSLAGAAKAVRLPIEKDTRGQALIRKFCTPRKPTKNNPSVRWMPEDAPEDWLDFCSYCIRDVEVERELYRRLHSVLSRHEQWVWEETMRMNERGLPVDTKLAAKTLEYLDTYSAKRVEECVDITFGITPTQRDKLLAWLKPQVPGLRSLQRIELERVLKVQEIDDEVRKVIEIRLEQGRVSTKKLVKMLEMDSGDQRVRGSFIYYGAGTGRFTATRLQPHNFQRPTIKNVPHVIKLLRTNPEQIEIEFPGQVLEAVGSAMRGFFKAPDGEVLVVADYNAIEARVLAWLAHQYDLVEKFHTGADVYVDMAGTIFKVDPVLLLERYKAEDIVADAQRKLGKDTILGCGYSMSMATFLLQMESKGSDTVAGVPIRVNPAMRGQHDKASYNPKAWKIATAAVYGYRDRYPRIPELWRAVEHAVKKVLAGRAPEFTVNDKLTFFKQDHFLVMRLPSGRHVYYPEAHLVDKVNKYTGQLEKAIRFRTVTDKGTWAWEETYGAKLVENAVQAISRDLMTGGMRRASQAGFDLIGTVHDEVLSLHSREGYRTAPLLRRYVAALCVLPRWAKGEELGKTVPLKADGYVAKRYRK